MQQRTAEWLDKSQINTDYHERQFREPYRSTVAFCNWLESEGLLGRDSQVRILDLCAGAGANMAYMSGRYPGASFVGVDLNGDLVNQGNEFFERNGIRNCRLEVGNIYDLDRGYTSRFDGILSFQTLLVLPEFRAPLQAMADLDPGWIAVTSLFYDGQVSCAIEATEYDNELNPHRTSHYNVYSLPVVRKFLKENGYPGFSFTPFEIDIDLPKPTKQLMSTYTEKVGQGQRLQISGPLLMPWHFVAARK